MESDILIVGAGITGITLAERLSLTGKRVLIVDERENIGGNCYDFVDKNGILVQKYGPHIFHTNNDNVWDYLSNFTKWSDYQHRVLAFIDGKYVSIPFNLNSIYECFPLKTGKILEEELIKLGAEKKISVLDLKKNKNKKIRFLADFIYSNIFLPYTQKQWGVEPEDIDSAVFDRVPIKISKNNKYFDDKNQGIPSQGYTKLFSKMIKKNNIKVLLKSDFKKIKDKINYKILFYTGRIDEFFDFSFGKLDYRCLKIDFKTLNKENYQPAAVINYPSLKYSFTRVTEFKKINAQKNIKKTVIGFEYPGSTGFPAWPLLNDKNKQILSKYQEQVNKLKSKKIYFVGRLAEYKYYDMDSSVNSALNLFNEISHEL